MILQNVKIKSFCVLKNAISISVSIDDNRAEVVDELKKMQSEDRKYSINSFTAKDNNKEKTGLYIDARLKSLSLSGLISFTLHTAVRKFVIFKLLAMKGCEGDTVIKFISPTESLLQQLTEKAAKRFNISPEEALIRATTFKSREKLYEMVPGKRNIFELSDRHKQVAVDKLQKMLKKALRMSI